MTTAIQARLLARQKNLGKLAAKSFKAELPTTKSFMITSFVDGKYQYDSLPFEQIISKTNLPIFFGCLHEGVSFYSLLHLSIKTNEVPLVTELLAKYQYSVHQTNTANYCRVILPLNKQINDPLQFEECIKSLASASKATIAHNFDDAMFIELKSPDIVNEGVAFDTKSFLSSIKAEKTKLKAEKNKRKLQAIKEGVYIVKRLSNDAIASKDSASLQNVSSFNFIGFLKAPFSVQQLKDYSTDPSISALMAKAIGVPDKAIKSLNGVSSSTTFKCLLTGGEAQLFIAENKTQYSGKVTYKILGTNERLSIHEVYARILTQQKDLNKPTLMCYLLRLLDECGLIVRTELKISNPPQDLTNAEKAVYDGFKHLTELKYCLKGQEGDPIVFTKSFGAMWANVSRITATKAINKLIDLNVIHLADEIKDYAAYRFYELVTKLVDNIKDKKQYYAAKLAQYAPNKLQRYIDAAKNRGPNHLVKSALKGIDKEKLTPLPDG